MTHILYGTRGSGSAAVEMAFRACGITWKHVDAASWKPASAVEQLAHANPLVQIPTVHLPDGTILTESAAILLHLALAMPQGRLLPESPGARAQAIRGLAFIAANCYAAVSIVDFPERWTTASTKAAHEEVREGARQRLFHHWEIFADMFVPSPYLSGDGPGALDYLAVVVSMWCGARDHIAKNRPSFAETLRRIQLHDAVEPVFRQHWDSAPS
jgi:GST-like protein